MIVEGLLALAAGGAVTAGLAAWVRREKRRWEALLAEVAARHGLAVRPATLIRSALLRGTLVGGLEVCVDLYTGDDEGQQYTRIRLRQPSIPSVRLQGQGVGLAKALGIAAAVEVGDPDFDGAVCARDLAPAALLALLDAEGRAAVAHLVREGGEVAKGALTLQRKGRAETARTLDELLAIATRAGRALLGGDGHERLLARAASDPVEGVRRRALGLVIADGRFDADWMRTRAEDDAPEVVLLAATALGEAGRERLWSLARSTERRAAALALARLAPDEAAAELEELLLRLFVERPDVETAEALGRVASVRSVQVLNLAVGPLGAVARAAREAVAAIQGRAPGAAGGLALVDHGGGELSVPPEGPGRLSVP